jgi:hypothetical protein
MFLARQCINRWLAAKKPTAGRVKRAETSGVTLLAVFGIVGMGF